MDWTAQVVEAQYRDAHSRICSQVFVDCDYIRGMLQVGYMRDASQAKPFRERAPRVQAPFDVVEAALNERRREQVREAVARFRMEPEPREFRECPALRRATLVKSAVGLWVEPKRMHPHATVRAVHW